MYLGATINEKMCDVEEIDKRMLKGTQLFGMLRQNLMASKDTWPEVKKQIFVGMTTPTLLDGAEHWVITDAKRREMNVVYNSMVRSSLRYTSCVTRKHRVTNEELHQKLCCRWTLYWSALLACVYVYAQSPFPSGPARTCMYAVAIVSVPVPYNACQSALVRV
jgi:hypothetical protein